jgi:ABC-type sugar transport system substrate-binding protein
VATARDRGIPVVTHDAAILAHSRSGHLATIAC